MPFYKIVRVIEETEVVSARTEEDALSFMREDHILISRDEKKISTDIVELELVEKK